MITVDDNLIAKLEKLSSLKIEDDKKEKIKVIFLKCLSL